jgi:hypothetical protein
MKAKLFFISFLLMVLSGFIIASDNNYSGELMTIGTGARALGMGGAFCAVADDASTLYWNSAGMTNIKGAEVSSVKLAKINDIDNKYVFVDLVYNAERTGAFGMGLLRQSIGGVQISSIDQAGEPILLENSYEIVDNILYMAYANTFFKGLSIGITGKVLYGNYPSYEIKEGAIGSAIVKYNGYGIDAGILLNIKEINLSAGINFQDIYTVINWEKKDGLNIEGEKVEMNIKPGLAYKLPLHYFNMVLAIDFDTKYNQYTGHYGMELWYKDIIGIRAGIKSWNNFNAGEIQQNPDWSLGGSMRWNFLGIDYAYINNELSPLQYLSIIGKF